MKDYIMSGEIKKKIRNDQSIEFKSKKGGRYRDKKMRLKKQIG